MIEREYKPESSIVSGQIKQEIEEARKRIEEARQKLRENLSKEDHERWDMQLHDATLELRGLEDLRDSLTHKKAA